MKVRIFNLIRTMAIIENIVMFEEEGFTVNILFTGKAFPFKGFPPKSGMGSDERKSPERYEEPTDEEVEKWQGKKEQ